MKMTTDIVERLRNAAMLAVEDDVIMLAAANEIEQLRLRCNASKELGAPTSDEPVAWIDNLGNSALYKSKHAVVPLYRHPPRKLDSGCQLAGPGRGDCEHAIGLPGIPITGQHDGEDTTVDANGKPNGWCWYCWQAHQIKELRKPRKFGYDAFNRWWIRQDDLKYGTAYESALAAAKWALENMK